jgi:hypothetical protein
VSLPDFLFQQAIKFDGAIDPDGPNYFLLLRFLEGFFVYFGRILGCFTGGSKKIAS